MTRAEPPPSVPDASFTGSLGLVWQRHAETTLALALALALAYSVSRPAHRARIWMEAGADHFAVDQDDL